MIGIRPNGTLSLLKLLLLLLASTSTAVAQTSSTEWKVLKPGVKDVQVPFASLKPSATIKIGGTADWVLITDDAVWVASTKPYAVQRIDPATNRIVAAVRVPGEACSGLAYGFGSIWVPLTILGRDSTRLPLELFFPAPKAEIISLENVERARASSIARSSASGDHGKVQVAALS